MTKLNLHGEPVADYVRHSTNSGEYCELTYRLMSDGVLLKLMAWGQYSEARVKQATSYKSGWRIAKVTPEIMANPDLLLTQGFKKKERYPTSL
ncbi:MAG: hypothetical protein ABSE28_24700 [Candidatus Sulfotelmatobacter sp.]|jgi:hypothetical protein